ncbi:MAG: helix-turn-helix transcriptional regulator [Eubacteriales bacterium]|nr:helix-turn-helix transcriptional regulator [Eubacteriales bacterium]
MKIGTQIAALRKSRGLTQAELGGLVGVSSQAVSKWESGGAPDAEMIPAVAEALNVTTDTLFGLERAETESMTARTARWLSTLPGETRLWELYRVLGATVSCLYGGGYDPALWQDSLSRGRIGADSSLNGTWVRSGLATEEGLLLGVSAADFPMYLLLPEPEGGYARNFAPTEAYRKLFSALARPGALELLLCLMGRKPGLYSAGALAGCTGLSREQTEAAIAGLVDCGVVSQRAVETESGPLAACSLRDSYGLVPLLYLARWVMDGSDFWSNGYFERKSPILREDAL